MIFPQSMNKKVIKPRIVSATVAQTVELRFLHKLCSPKSHRRLPPVGFRKARTCVETLAVEFALLNQRSLCQAQTLSSRATSINVRLRKQRKPGQFALPFSIAPFPQLLFI